jgi:hypothetical protein
MFNKWGGSTTGVSIAKYAGPMSFLLSPTEVPDPQDMKRMALCARLDCRRHRGRCFLGASEPVSSLVGPGILEHPRVCHGLVTDPKHEF